MTALRPATRAFRALDDRDLPEVRRLVDADPLVNAVVGARIDAARTLRSDLLGGELVGLGRPGALNAACYLGGNVLPLGGDPDSWRELGRYLGARQRMCSSMIATAEAIDALWPAVAAGWGPARMARRNQPLLVTDRPAPGEADVHVRTACAGDLEHYLPAAAAMFAEELGIAPFHGTTSPGYRSRLAELIAAGQVFVRTDHDDRIVFKAEVGAVSRATCQVQGVWVRPDLRGRRIATAAMAAVIAACLRMAPTVSLYVNDFNLPARRLYDRLGMRQVGTLATVLF